MNRKIRNPVLALLLVALAVVLLAAFVYEVKQAQTQSGQAACAMEGC